MRITSALLGVALLTAACSGSDDAATTTTAAATTEATTTTTQATTTTTTEATTTTAAETTTTAEETTTSEATTTTGTGSAQFALSTVGFGDSAMIVITNIGGSSGDLGGHFLCQRPAYWEIPSVELAPLEAVAISAGGSAFTPPPDAKTIEDQAAVGNLNPGSGEIGLYTTNTFGDPDTIVSYVEWGASGHGRSSVAVAAGIWSEGSFVDTDDTSVTIVASLLPAEDPIDWEIVSG